MYHQSGRFTSMLWDSKNPHWPAPECCWWSCPRVWRTLKCDPAIAFGSCAAPLPSIMHGNDGEGSPSRLARHGPRMLHLNLRGHCTNSSAAQSPMQPPKFIEPFVSISLVESYHKGFHSTDNHVLAANVSQTSGVV